MAKNATEMARERWENELTEQGRQRALERYTVDQLADEYAPLPAVFFDSEKGKLSYRPTISGTRVAKITATPRKKALRDQAMNMDKHTALIEIIDNCIDNCYKCHHAGYLAPLHIRVHIYEDEIMVFENSGGIHPENLVAFVAVGESGQDKGIATIGVWSQALKYAFYALGKLIVVTSHHWDHQSYLVEEKRLPTVALRLDEEWYHDELGWDVPIYEPGKTVPAGETHYSFRHLHGPFTSQQVADLGLRIAALYSDLLLTMGSQGLPVTITINEQDIMPSPLLTDDAIRRTFVFTPGYEPRWVQEELNKQVDGRSLNLRCSILAGLTAEYDKEASGVYMWGCPGTDSENELGPRLFEWHYRDAPVGYGEHGNKLLNWNDNTLGRLRVYVVFHGTARDIPWAGPAKWGYRYPNLLGEEIKALIKSVADPYAKLARAATELDLLPYSTPWQEKSQGERLAFVSNAAKLQTEDPEAGGLWTTMPSVVVDAPAFAPTVDTVSVSDFKAQMEQPAVTSLPAKIKKRQQVLLNQEASDTAKAEAVVAHFQTLHATPLLVDHVTRAPENERASQVLSCKISLTELAQLGELTRQTRNTDILREVINTYVQVMSSVPAAQWDELILAMGVTSKGEVIRAAIDAVFERMRGR